MCVFWVEEEEEEAYISYTCPLTYTPLQNHGCDGQDLFPPPSPPSHTFERREEGRVWTHCGRRIHGSVGSLLGGGGGVSCVCLGRGGGHSATFS